MTRLGKPVWIKGLPKDAYCRIAQLSHISAAFSSKRQQSAVAGAFGCLWVPFSHWQKAPESADNCRLLPIAAERRRKLRKAAQACISQRWAG
eukprot:8750560-Alexandrium_andersonii.AAC.1